MESHLNGKSKEEVKEIIDQIGKRYEERGIKEFRRKYGRSEKLN